MIDWLIDLREREIDRLSTFDFNFDYLLGLVFFCASFLYYFGLYIYIIFYWFVTRRYIFIFNYKIYLFINKITIFWFFCVRLKAENRQIDRERDQYIDLILCFFFHIIDIRIYISIFVDNNIIDSFVRSFLCCVCIYIYI